MQVRTEAEKWKGCRMRWYGHTQRRDEKFCVNKAVKIKLPGRNTRGRPTIRWEDNVKANLKSFYVNPEGALILDL